MYITAWLHKRMKNEYAGNLVFWCAALDAAFAACSSIHHARSIKNRRPVPVPAAARCPPSICRVDAQRSLTALACHCRCTFCIVGQPLACLMYYYDHVSRAAVVLRTQ